MSRLRGRRPAPRPLPQREGIDAVRWVIPPGHPRIPARVALETRFPALLDPAATPLEERFARGEVVRADGTAWADDEAVRPGDALFFHREFAPEDVPHVELPVLLRDEHLLVVDKPHGIATMPRGAHVRGSALARLRRATGLEDLTPLHRLDRLTAGVLAFGILPDERAAYQSVFSAPAAAALVKTYRAVVPDPGWKLGEQHLWSDRLVKPRGSLHTLVGDGPVNARTVARVLDRRPLLADGPDPTNGPASASALLELTPLTGRTHQLRAQCAHRGIPIHGDTLYGGQDAPDLQLLAASLAFTDPVTGQRRHLRSRRGLACWPADRPGPARSRS